MTIWWLEQTVSGMPSGDGWLSPAELLRLNAMKFPKRRADFRLGRWTAKRAAATLLGLPDGLAALAGLDVHADCRGAPVLYHRGRPARISLSISHSAGVALCAVAEGECALGCDVERIEEHSTAFIADYFTTQEQVRVREAPHIVQPLLATEIWSAKESVLKVTREGLRADTRDLCVRSDSDRLGGAEWAPLEVTYCGSVYRGWASREREFVRTVISEPASTAPVIMRSEPSPSG